MTGQDRDVRLMALVATRLGDRLLGFARLLTQDIHRAEDLRSELRCRLVDLVRADPRFATLDLDEATDDEWEVLYKHLAGCLFNLFRNARRLVERREKILGKSGSPEWIGNPSPDPLAAVLCGRILEQLSTDDARILVMRHRHGLPIKAIVEELGCSETAVTSRLSRALKRARKIAGVTKRRVGDM